MQNCRVADIIWFCSVLSYFVFQDDKYTAFSDHRPASTNHLLIITNEHVDNITNLQGRTEVGKFTFVLCGIHFHYTLRISILNNVVVLSWFNYVLLCETYENLHSGFKKRFRVTDDGSACGGRCTGAGKCAWKCGGDSVVSRSLVVSNDAISRSSSGCWRRRWLETGDEEAVTRRWWRHCDQSRSSTCRHSRH